MPIFDDKRSIGHFILGAIAAVLGVASIIIIFIFVFYQKKEKEPDLNKLGDFIEFLLGYAYGLAVRAGL